MAGGWTKKINKACKNDFEPGEELIAGVFVQPMGTTSKLMVKEVGDLVGKLVVGSTDTEDNASQGHASALPDERLVLGLTDQRLMVWGHSQLSGKPKGFKMALPATEVASVQFEKLKTIYAFVLEFADGSSKLFEAPRMMNDPEAFATAVDGAVTPSA